ncbi:MAG: hypothetical protein B7Y83_17380 [Flavobacteriales bacterium 32-34-25]|nr:MAG: hypothetical protein B7Y83_17380 [Flavobacteriales bacterium 32-34-25]
MISGFLKVEFSIILQILHQEVWVKTTKGLGFFTTNCSASSNVWIFNWAKPDGIAQKKINTM